MGLKLLFQTLANKDNPDEVENQGPFPCKKEPWLGRGYYFWDTFKELAHWWGKVGYHGNYFICECYCNDCSSEIFDLVGNTSHILEFKKYAQAIQEIYPEQKLTVPFIIEHMKKRSKFIYRAIRANPIGCTNGDEYLKTQRMYFIRKNSAYLDMTPPIQICIIDKSFVNNNSFKIIYPEEYCTNYTI
nr:MAG TPA: hypothetical protein [Bacteriophage sp.]